MWRKGLQLLSSRAKWNPVFSWPLFLAAVLVGAQGCSSGGPDGEGSSAPAQGGSVTLAWDAPSENLDGSALDDLAGFKIYDGPTSGNYTKVTDTGNVSQFTLDSLPAGTYYIVVAAYDVSGNESDLSAEIEVTLR